MGELNLGDGERNVLILGREGDKTMARRAKQDYYNYTLRDGRFIVKHGITTEPRERFDQMKSKGLRFTSMCVDSVAVSEKTARKREKQRIKTHERSHTGRKPRYNK